MLVVGANGVGKTNLLESLHLGTQGFSPRTRVDSQLIRFGADVARVRVNGRREADVPVELEVTLRVREGKRARMNGAALRAAEQLRGEVVTLVFTPDRLAVIKGGPAVRRAYVDRSLARLLPARAAVSTSYAATLAQRNAALRRVALGVSSRDALEPWSERLVELGRELVEARLETLAILEPPFRAAAEALGIHAAALRYVGEAPTTSALAARLERDLERATTGAGPHLDDVGVLAGERDLRLYGSQGEQRLAVLALLLAEASALAQRRGLTPLLLLDDVLSELDAERRRVLLRLLPGGGQAILTATGADAFPGEPALTVAVEPGAATAA